MSQIALIEKYSPLSDLWPNLIRKKKIAEFSVDQIVNKYQGFEGELISFLHPLESKLHADHQHLECPSIYILSKKPDSSNSLENTGVIVGFDVGVCDEEKSIFSSIFNEILFGSVDELVAYKSFLNENLLFPDVNLAEKYVATHHRLSLQGKDVENYEELVIYQIIRPKIVSVNS